MAILYTQYALMAVGLVPMMIFLVDYVARGLGLGAQQGALFWIAYGIGAIVGPMMYGAMGDRITPLVTSRIAMLGQIAAIAVLVSTSSIPALILATLVIGTFPPGIVPIYLSQIQRILPGNAEKQSAAWSRATTIYALCQALVGYASSWLLAASGGQHRLLFMLAASGLVASLAIELTARLLTARKAGLTINATRQ
jgi:predicted MFS family arabinose efflux permease